MAIDFNKDLETARRTLRGLQVDIENETNPKERLRLEIESEELEKLIDDLQSKIQEQEAKEERTQRHSHKAKAWKIERPLIDKALEENNLGYLSLDDRFILCKDYGESVVNVQFRHFSGPRIKRTLSHLIGRNIEGKTNDELVDYVTSKPKCSFLDSVSSFNNAKWSGNNSYNKMLIARGYWLKPDFSDKPVHAHISLLIHSICGGKQENIEHIEKWVAYKYLFPERCSNIPNVDLGGRPGGNGKGRFVEMLKTIFGSSCVVAAHRSELTDNFNSSWENAVILYYDEPEDKELPAAKLKQATGSEDVRIERKGLDATASDRNFNFLFISNNEKGVVKLSGGGDGAEDRRWSVISTNLVLYDQMIECGLSPEETRTEVNELAQKTIKNRAEVAIWLGNIIKKYNVEAMASMPALHGQDYLERFEEQKDTITSAFDAVLPVFMHHGFIPQTVLGTVIRVLTDNEKHKDNNVSNRFMDYLRQHKIEVVSEPRQKYKLKFGANDAVSKQTKLIRLKGKHIGVNDEFDWGMISNRNFNLPGVQGSSQHGDLYLTNVDIKLFIE